MKMKMNLGWDGGKLIPSELISDKQNKQDQQDNKTRTRTKRPEKTMTDTGSEENYSSGRTGLDLSSQVFLDQVHQLDIVEGKVTHNEFPGLV